jgi:hypothetical protein
MGCQWEVWFHGHRPGITRFRGASHNSRGKTLDKLPFRRQGKSPLKYANYGVCISLERKFCLLEESLGSYEYRGWIFFHWTNSWSQNSQKVLPYRYFGGHWLVWRPSGQTFALHQSHCWNPLSVQLTASKACLTLEARSHEEQNFSQWEA